MSTPLPAVDAAPSEKDDPTIWRVDYALWVKLAPILRCDKVRKKPGRPRRDDRALFDGLIWLARTGSQWAALPREFGPKSTVHERFSEWVVDDKPKLAWAVLLAEYDAVIGLDWSWLVADGCIVKAPFGKKRGAGEDEAAGRNPTDRGKPGTMRHLLTEKQGIPIACLVTGANHRDMKKLAELLDAVLVPARAAIEAHLALDRGYDYGTCRAAAADRGYVAHIAPKASAASPLPPPGAGWSRLATVGSIASGACSPAGNTGARTTSASSSWPPSSSSTASSATLAHFPDSVLEGV